MILIKKIDFLLDVCERFSQSAIVAETLHVQLAPASSRRRCAQSFQNVRLGGREGGDSTVVVAEQCCR